MLHNPVSFPINLILSCRNGSVFYPIVKVSSPGELSRAFQPDDIHVYNVTSMIHNRVLEMYTSLVKFAILSDPFENEPNRYCFVYVVTIDCPCVVLSRLSQLRFCIFRAVKCVMIK